jgi:phosphocarrier protein
MLEFQSEIKNKIGVHLRAAGEFVKVANRFSSRVTVMLNGKKADGKSILGLASMAIGKGAVITIQVEGEDEEQAKEALCELIENDFNEN